jgi:hypothetical protein
MTMDGVADGIGLPRDAGKKRRGSGNHFLEVTEVERARRGIHSDDLHAPAAV